MSTALKYRPEIDGLRSIAVLPVVLFHFSVPGFTGGFVGVDIFFVISGFLIGTILWAECQGTGRISLVNFYVRRFRRLAPAYFAMCLATGLVGYALLLPAEFYEFGKSLIASTVYLSNVFFYMGAGYFDSAAEEKFLLHTWSLAVEEQFYVFLPLFLLLLGGHRQRTLVLSWILAAVSLVACVWITSRDHSAAFYLFPFRAWELFAGVLLAMHISGRPHPLSLGPWVSWAGMILLAGSIMLIPAGTGFPGYFAVAPVLGTVLVLANGQEDNSVNRLLSTRPAVLIGLISYSLYIWHWPVATLSLYYRGEYSGTPELLFWLGVTFMISWLSWKYVETPFRRGQVNALRVFGAVALGSIALMAFGAMVYLGKGLPQRFGPETREAIAATSLFGNYERDCVNLDQSRLEDIGYCVVGDPFEADRYTLIWGDSHSPTYRTALAAAAPGTDALIVWSGGCPALFDVRVNERVASRADEVACQRRNAAVRRMIETDGRIDSVILLGRWSYYGHGTGLGVDGHNGIQVWPKGQEFDADRDQYAVYTALFEETVATLTQLGKKAFVIEQPPEFPEFNSRAFAMNMLTGRLAEEELARMISIPVSQVAERQGPMMTLLARLEKEGRITVLPTHRFLCDGTSCSSIKDGAPLYYDNNHLATSMVPKIAGMFDPFVRYQNQLK